MYQQDRHLYQLDMMSTLVIEMDYYSNYCQTLVTFDVMVMDQLQFLSLL